MTSMHELEMRIEKLEEALLQIAALAGRIHACEVMIEQLAGVNRVRERDEELFHEKLRAAGKLE